jgi:uncharacterized surface protein with fasciclin (FAS1) repeats
MFDGRTISKTYFVPSAEALEFYLEQKERTLDEHQQIAKSFIVQGREYSTELNTQRALSTIKNSQVKVYNNKKRKVIRYGLARIIESDIAVENAVIHIVDYFGPLEETYYPGQKPAKDYYELYESDDQ